MQNSPVAPFRANDEIPLHQAGSQDSGRDTVYQLFFHRPSPAVPLCNIPLGYRLSTSPRLQVPDVSWCA
jgi:hypothetical protein